MQSLLRDLLPCLNGTIAPVGSAEGLLKGLLSHTPTGVFMSDANGECRFVNGRWSELTGLTFEEALGDGWVAALHPDDRERVAREWQEAAGEQRDSVVSYRFRRPDGSVVWIEGYASALLNAQGELVGWVGSCLDVTGHQQAERALLQERELFGVAFEGAPIGMALVTPGGRFLRTNSALCNSLGYSEAELRDRSVRDVTHPGDSEADADGYSQLVRGEIDSYRCDKRYLRRDGSVFWGALSVALIRDEHGRPLHFVAQVKDIQERKLAEEELRSQAEHDSLTGLLNRRSLERELELCQRRLARRFEGVSMILIDVDHFKDINDTLGHQAGDEALVQVARVLEHRLRESDVLARLGGDEFAVLARSNAPERLANELLNAVRASRIAVDSQQNHLTVSAGIVGLRADLDPSALFAAVDQALYQAKNTGRDRAIHAEATRRTPGTLTRDTSKKRARRASHR